MPRYHLHAARRGQRPEPLTLTLTGEDRDGKALPEFEEQFPAEMPASIQVLCIEAALDQQERADEEEEGASDPLGVPLGPEFALRMLGELGRDRLRRWMLAGYDGESLGQLVAVLMYYWREGRFPNQEAPTGSGASPNGSPSATPSSAETSRSGAAS